MTNKLLRHCLRSALLFCTFATLSGLAQDATPGPTQLEKYVCSYLQEHQSDVSATKYSFAFAHLSGEKEKEAIVYLVGRDWCGSGGCTVLILAPEGGTFRKISTMTVSKLPIRVLDTLSNGWRDLGVWVEGGGIDAGYEARMRFNGKKYPLNPSTAPKSSPNTAGAIVIPKDAEALPLTKP